MPASHKEVGFLLVGVDVLGDPLRQNFIRRKQRDNPDRFSRSVGELFCMMIYFSLIFINDFRSYYFLFFFYHR